MSSRIYLIGQAMSGLLARSQGRIDPRDLKNESEAIADFMLEED